MSLPGFVKLPIMVSATQEIEMNVLASEIVVYLVQPEDTNRTVFRLRDTQEGVVTNLPLAAFEQTIKDSYA
ncbi:MAG: hypothetical protein ACKO0Z_07010 [Betaproteobacteria bacterium]